MKHVIVGNGPAGVNAAVTLRRISPRDQVAVVTEEAQPFYSKVVTSYFIAGKAPYEKLLLVSAQQFQQQEIELLAMKRAVSVDTARQEVTLSGGERIRYDRLLLATGASPAMPPIEGTKLPGVFTLWTHDDAVALDRWIQKGQRAVVIGAGLVGLKAAEAFLMRGLSATVVELLDRVLPQLLGPEDATRAQKELQRRGLSIRTGASVVQIEGDGRVQRVVLGDNTVLECEVVVIATGVRPNLTLARSAGIALGRGILVDEFMQTSAANVFAAGDAVEAWDVARGRKLLNPTWGNASEHGRVAAYNMAGMRKPFSGAVSMNSFTFLDFSMAAVGITHPEGNFLRVESYTDPRTGDYRKLVTLGNRLVGAVAMGDVRMAGVWRGLIARGAEDAPAAGAILARKTDFARTHNLGL